MAKKGLRPYKIVTFDDDTIQDIRAEFPIRAHRINSIIERINEQYPLIDRVNITLVVQSFFETLRDEILSGGIVTIKPIFLTAFLSKLTNSNRIKLQTNTPEFLK